MYLLRPPTLRILAQMLNPTKILLSDDGHLRDWRGLAELIGIDMLAIQNFESQSDPFKALFHHSLKNLTVLEVIAIFEKMDRYDIIDDTQALFESDLSLQNECPNLSLKSFENETPVTIDDSEHIKESGSLLQYDAFILYAREDQEFVNEVIDKMEGEYGLKLCLKDRDLIAGLPFEHQAVTELITNRCRFVVPIFSPNFLNSEENKFFVNFTEALGIEKGCRKVVPCVYQSCSLPKSVSYYSRLDYTKRSQYWDFWSKMNKSLEKPASSLHTEQISKTDLKVKSDVAIREKKDPTSSFSSTEVESAAELFNNAPNEETKSKNWLKRIIKKPKKKIQKEKALAC